MSLPKGATEARRLGGGDINEAWRVVLADGTQAFVKTRTDASPEEYMLEAASLRWLGEPEALRVPQVLEVTAEYLVLEWIEPGHLSGTGTRQLGEGLAALHAAGAACFGDPGLAAGVGAQARIGSLQLPNEPCPDWPAFYAQRRLLPLAKMAAQRDVLSRAGVAAVERVCERLPELSGPPEKPARLHGDLWRGNVCGDANGDPWLIDPSAYGGHREVDLSMLRLFGSPSDRIFDFYEAVTPLADGWQERVGLWQLMPLLVHAVLFGGSYCQAAERLARRYA
ncbi:MAG TPA: fructosamine kinase family protein [Solirubrobacteraceae bacterium]|jgi:fructosamine-3-kinase